MSMSLSERKINDRRRWKAEAFPYDYFLPDNSRECQYCLTDKQAEILRGIVETIGWSTRWWSDSDTAIDTDEIETFRDDIIRRLMMSCCGDEAPVIYRYNSDGVYQRSTDGGATWTDAPEYDYRNTSTMFPPPSAVGVDSTKCQNADGVVQTIKQEIIDEFNDALDFAEIMVLITVALLTVLSAGTVALIDPLITAAGAAIATAGAAVVKEAFTDDVWGRLLCNIFNNMATDDEIDAAGLAAVLARLGIDETGIVYVVLYGIINAAGVVGITNMLRSNKGSPDADCSDCTPPVCSTDDWGLYQSGQWGNIISRTDSTITVQAVFAGDGHYHITLGNPTGGCCILSGVDWNKAAGVHVIPCESPYENGSFIDHDESHSDTICCKAVDIVDYLGGAVTITITFNSC